MSSKEIGIEQARKVLGDLADAAHHQGEITLLTKYGRPYAAVVPLNRIAQESAMAPAFIFHGTVGHTRKGRRIEPARIPPLTGTSQRHRYDINSVEEARDFVQSIFNKDDSIIRIEYSYTLDGERITEEANRPAAPATGTLSVTVPFNPSDVSETGNRAQDAAYQWCDAAEAEGYGRIETVSYEVPDTAHDIAIVAVGDSTYLLTVRGGRVYADAHEYAGVLCRAPFAVNGVEQGWVCDLRKGHPGQHENTTTMGLPSTPVED